MSAPSHRSPINELLQTAWHEQRIRVAEPEFCCEWRSWFSGGGIMSRVATDIEEIEASVPCPATPVYRRDEYYGGLVRAVVRRYECRYHLGKTLGCEFDPHWRTRHLVVGSCASYPTLDDALAARAEDGAADLVSLKPAPNSRSRRIAYRFGALIGKLLLRPIAASITYADRARAKGLR